jgi:hypothetical protein
VNPPLLTAQKADFIGCAWGWRGGLLHLERLTENAAGCYRCFVFSFVFKMDERLRQVAILPANPDLRRPAGRVVEAFADNAWTF